MRPISLPLAAGAALALGLAALVAGFAYDIMFAGIPYQDPPPDVAARYAFHATVAARIELAGALIALAGLIGLCLAGGAALLRRARG